MYDFLIHLKASYPDTCKLLFPGRFMSLDGCTVNIKLCMLISFTQTELLMNPVVV